MKSIKAISAVALVATLTLAGCSSGANGGDAGGDVTIEFQTGFAVDDGEMTLMKELVSEFEASNQGVTIDLIAAGTDYESDMKVRLAAGTAPDIWNTHGWSLLRYSEFLLPLEDQPWADDVIDSLDETMRNDAGEIFALPTNIDISGLIYNADVLEAAGVDPYGIESWDDFDDAADAVNSDTVSPIYQGGKPLAGALADRVVSGTFDDDDLAEMLDGSFVTPAYEEMLDLVQDWGDSGYFNPDYSSASRDDMAKALAQGQAAFMYGPSLLFDNAWSFNPDANLGFMPIPTTTGAPRYLVGGERTAFGISNKTENPDEAKAFIAFLAENDTALAAASTSPPGLTTATMELGKLQPSFEKWMTEEEVPVLPYFDRVYLPNGSWESMQVTTDVVITGQGTPAQATEQMKSTYDSLRGQSE
ncbi:MULTISPECIES: ABC transporter substrate-binding protein [unclassified Salinibacterium]|uniref:ABC transporter substrate-binding protein n=1 Tax=unclassified Salinibacterium TaxID=2632331 RepID=UPI0018CEAEDF|nr:MULTISPECIES: extracellular solute-binding protein [unclassified Salinibacterium]MBH0055139.1 extracellular solute-binding protein [Salinibacterium sp. SWN139]MBH0084566.1 extracellular solute-binding protein [Salinibacterium sp. SWN167]